MADFLRYLATFSIPALIRTVHRRPISIRNSHRSIQATNIYKPHRTFPHSNHSPKPLAYPLSQPGTGSFKPLISIQSTHLSIQTTHGLSIQSTHLSIQTSFLNHPSIQSVHSPVHSNHSPIQKCLVLREDARFPRRSLV